MQKMHNLIEIRSEIDKIDKRMIGLIAKRAEFVKAATKLKKSVEEVHAKNRVNEVMRTRRHWAKTAGISPDLIEGIYKRLVAYFVNEEKKEYLIRSRNSYKLRCSMQEY